MNYKFPHITHIDQVKKAIEGNEEFIIKVDQEHGIAIVNYNFALT